MSETEATAAAVACVPDVISSILERVPDLVSLFRCSLVCKEWRRLVSDPAFLRRRGILPEPDGGHSPSQSTASLLGIFVQRDRTNNSRPRKISKRFPTSAPAFVPAPGTTSVLGPQLRFLTSFVRDDDGILEDATPLATRDGLLLVRIRCRPSSTDKTSGGGGLLLRLCVCNLLTGRRDLLPALDVEAAFHASDVHGYALLTAADIPHDACPGGPANGYSAVFQVLVIGGGHGERLHLRRFSSASGGDWDALDRRQRYLYLMLRAQEPDCRVAAVARGTAHWFFRDEPPSFYTIDVSAAAGTAGRISKTMLPVDAVDAIVREAGQYMPLLLCTTAMGRLALLCVQDNNRLLIVKQRDDDDNGGHRHWDLTEVHLDVELGFGDQSISLVCVWERSSTALAVYSSEPERAYLVDLQSGSASRVEGWIRSFNYMTAVPCEIDGAMFFMSRLGVKL